MLAKRIEEQYCKRAYAKTYEIHMNQRDALNDLKKSLYDLDTNQWELWNELFQAILDFQNRERRFGKTSEQLED